MAASNKPRILVVDDEKAIRRFLKLILVSHGYDVFEASRGVEALRESVDSHPDAIILDLGLPDMDGLEVLKEIRRRSRMPILIVSVRETVEDRLGALDAGADDYLTKPFDAREVLARLKAVTRRLIPIGKQTIFKVRGLSVDIAQHRAELDGKPVSLTPKEYDILKVLVLNAGAVMTHRNILAEVWDKSGLSPKDIHLVRATIKNLRDKIEPDPSQPTYILNLQGVGYRLMEDEAAPEKSS